MVEVWSCAGSVRGESVERDGGAGCQFAVALCSMRLLLRAGTVSRGVAVVAIAIA